MEPVRHHTVQVPATSANLGPGFDAFGLAVSRHLWVRTVDAATQPERVAVRGDQGGGLATGDDNLIWRSLVAFCEHHDAAIPDVALVTTSQIPLERGLGSSSSAIVAGVVLGRALTGVPCGDRELVALAALLEGHPDNVAPALLGGLVACATDDAGALVTRRINPAAALRPIVFVPSERQGTVAARAVLPASLDAGSVAVQAARAGHVLAGLTGVWPVAPQLAGDRLHEPPRLAVMPAAGGLLQALRERQVHAWLSGAGPSVAAVVDARGDDLVVELGSLAAMHGFEALAARFDLSGALVCPDGACALSGTPECVQCPRRRV